MDSAPERDPELWASLSKRARMKRRGDVWLERSVSWHGIAGVWKGVKVLGNGSYGLCGLFEYQGSDQDMPKHIVVKQSGRPDTSLQNESRLLKRFGDTGTVHIVKMYKSYHQEGGTGTSADFDPSPFTYVHYLGNTYDESKEVSRIYLEYCDRTDMSQLIKYLQTRHARLSEWAVWCIMECLARAAMVLELGHEGGSNRDPLHKPIAHFDLKPSNILMSGKDENHTSNGIFKFADFGLSRTVPDIQSPGWFQYAGWRWTKGYGSPEQVYPSHNSRFIGTPCNIWGIAASIYSLLLDGQTVPQELFTLNFNAPFSRPPIRTMGSALLNNQAVPYSAFLKQTLLTCLAWEPDQRPTAQQLLESCSRALAALVVTPDFPPPSAMHYDKNEELEILAWEPGPHRPFTFPRHVGDTALGPPGPNDFDILNLGSGLSSAVNIDMNHPMWPELPPSPRPVPAYEPRRSSADPDLVRTERDVTNPTAQAARDAQLLMDFEEAAAQGERESSAEGGVSLQEHRAFNRDLPSAVRDPADRGMLEEVGAGGEAGPNSGQNTREAELPGISLHEAFLRAMSDAERAGFPTLDIEIGEDDIGEFSTL